MQAAAVLRYAALRCTALRVGATAHICPAICDGQHIAAAAVPGQCDRHTIATLAGPRGALCSAQCTNLRRQGHYASTVAYMLRTQREHSDAHARTFSGGGEARTPCPRPRPWRVL